MFNGAADDTRPYSDDFQFTGDRAELSAASTSIYVADDTLITPHLGVAESDDEDFASFNDIQSSRKH